ncbi:MAG TPA: ABC transporter ATP-binding protein [Ktedonosporobacter sp.]|nr:ABC transporter ATP-binding protein [Ktedonosporobacter sp.]
MAMRPMRARAGKKKAQEEEFKLSHVLTAFTSLPRVLGLVWSTSVPLTAGMAGISLLRGCTPAATAVISKLVIDAVVHGIRIHSVTPIWLPVILQLAVGLLDRFLSVLSNVVQQLLQEQVANRVQLMILEKTNTLDLAFFENPEFYDKLRHASEESNYKPVTMISQTFDLVRSTITLLSMLIILLQLAWWLAIVALVIPIPSFIASTRYGWIGYQRMRRQSPERRKLFYFNHVMTVDQYNKEIKLFNLGGFFIRLYRLLAEKFYEENKGILTRRYLIGFAWSSLGVMANSGIYLYVALQAVLGRITLGGLTLYTQSAMQVGSSFQGVLDGVSNTYENNLFVNTLFEFLEYHPLIASPEKPSPIRARPGVKGLDIEFRDVSFTYPGKEDAALKHVSFTIKAGEAIALVGRNGAGKTTMVKLLTRLYDPDEGEILIGGRNIKEYSLEELREQVGVIFQDFVNYQLSARENIGVGRIAEVDNLDLIASSARKSGANAVIERLTDGYETMLGKWFDEGVQLSGGEWQKVALARAFMREASILVLDEPTSSLDAQAEYEVFSHFRALTEEKTAIFISHRFSTVRLADRIFVLENGNILEDGSHTELIDLDGRYAELFNLQAEAYR